MKRISCIILVAFMGISLISCGTPAAQEISLSAKVGALITPTLNSFFKRKTAALNDISKPPLGNCITNQSNYPSAKTTVFLYAVEAVI